MPTPRYGAQYLSGTETVASSWNKVNGAFDAFDGSVKVADLNLVIANDWTVMGWSVTPIVTSGTWSWSYVANQLMTHFGYNASNTQNNEYRWMANLAKGTYRFDFVSDTDPSRAIATWELSFDGGTTWSGGTNGLAIGAFDLYTAAAGFNNLVSVTGLVVPVSGQVLIRLRNPTRNAASSGWYVTLTSATLQRTS